MSSVQGKYVPPAIDQTAFSCPHCGALAKQFWLGGLVARLEESQTPTVITPERLEELDFNEIKDPAARMQTKRRLERLATGRPFLEAEHVYSDYVLKNLSLSRCFNCNDVAIWISDRLFWPRRGEAPMPNFDLPPDVREDYIEASTILDLSPRGAAALLRLAIQKLCKHLDEKGKDINADIGALVRKGLDPRVQKSLDSVRVIGNHAVHPGQIDLKDDRATAEALFGLVNLIAEIMISQPKHVQAVYDSLPQGAKDQIAKRDGKKP